MMIKALNLPPQRERPEPPSWRLSRIAYLLRWESTTKADRLSFADQLDQLARELCSPPDRRGRRANPDTLRKFWLAYNLTRLESKPSATAAARAACGKDAKTADYVRKLIVAADKGKRVGFAMYSDDEFKKAKRSLSQIHRIK